MAKKKVSVPSFINDLTELFGGWRKPRLPRQLKKGFNVERRAAAVLDLKGSLGVTPQVMSRLQTIFGTEKIEVVTTKSRVYIVAVGYGQLQ